MANIVDEQAIAFANARMRHSADLLAQLYSDAVLVVSLWNALNVSAMIPNTSDVIMDGSPADGRQSITGSQATTIITRLTEFVADYDATSYAKLNTVLQVAPNP